MLVGFSGIAQNQKIDSKEDEAIVKKAVIAWADTIFYKHAEYRFENFHAFYTDDYFIAVMRSDIYKERLEKLRKRKAAGSYKGSNEKYEKELKVILDKYNLSKKTAESFEERAAYYQIYFWSNIQTTDGLSVYYEHIVRLDNDYKVTSYTENSSIGKKNSSAKIMFN